MFVNQSGLYVFVMFDDYSGSIQLWFCVLAQLIFIPWIFGMDKLSALMEARTQERIPKFVVYVIKFFIPLYIFVLFILAWVSEFSASTAEGRAATGWTAGITWLGRMIWFLPFIMMIVGFAFPNVQDPPSIYDLIKDQYGITFDEQGKPSSTKVAATDEVANDMA